jgi:cytochrome oxidase Cu insertion factor (SCO1/SenC/PrrC family)
MTTSINARHQVITVALLAAGVASGALAQAPAAATPSVPAVGSVAPEFTLPGATRYGPLAQPVKLSDFRGKTVVLAFFFQARTKG